MKVIYADGNPYGLSIIETEKFEQPEDFMTYNNAPADQEELYERIKQAEAIMLGCTKLTNKTMARCEQLRFICFLGSGAASYVDIQQATRHGIVVANTPNYGDNTVAEHALALLLAAARNLLPLDRKMRCGIWDRDTEGVELRGKILGILGLGNVGACMARIGNGLGMKILCWTKNPSPQRASAHRVKFVELDELLSHSDFISVHLSYSAITHRLIGEREFALMKRDAIFINTSRGGFVDTESLVSALSEGRLRAAGIDVFEKEPLESVQPILGCENVVLTPHVGFNAREARVNIMRLGLNNVMQFLRGKPVNVVNPEVLTRTKSA